MRPSWRAGWVVCLGAVAVGLLAVPAPAAAGQCAGPATVVNRTASWAQQRLAPEQVWPLTRGAGVTVAVLDSGVSAAAPPLAGAVLPGLDAMSGSGPANSDCTGQGTFVAGLVAARPVSGVPFAGLAPGARILPVRVTDADGNTNADVLARGIQAAVAAHAQVVAVSASTPSSSPALRAAIAAAVAQDVLVVAPAAVTGDAQDAHAAYPAALSGVLAVTALRQDGTLVSAPAPGSPPAIAAPGADIVGIGVSGDGHVTGDSDAFAVAYVAGAAALVRAYHPAMPFAQVARRMLETADHPSWRLPDPQLGYGVLDPYAAVARLLREETGDTRIAVPPYRLDVPVPPAPEPSGPNRRAWGVACVALVFLIIGLPMMRLAAVANRRRSRPAR